MPAERYYTEASLEEGSSVTLEGGEHHHVAHVMRSKEEEVVELVNGKGALAQAKIRSLKKRVVELELISKEQAPEEDRELILIQAIPRQGRLDTILEKGTELGVTSFWLFPGERGERKLKEQQIQKLKSTLVSALKQCGRLYLPEIKLLPSLKKWNELPSNCYFGDFSEEAKPLSSQRQAAIVIGPESGLSDEEIRSLRSLGATGATLHHNILRADTAAIVALALLSQ